MIIVAAALAQQAISDSSKGPKSKHGVSPQPPHFNHIWLVLCYS